MQKMLTSNQLAELTCYSKRTINRKVKSGELKAVITINKLNKSQNMFPVDQLPKNIKDKYLMQHADEQIEIIVDGKKARKFNDKEREQIEFWSQVVKQWRSHRNASPLSFTEVDDGFVAMMKLNYPDVQISKSILYRKYHAYITNDLEGLIDHRGKSNKGRTKVTPEMRGAYRFYFLNQAQHSYKKCYEYMKLAIAEDYPEQLDFIPSERTMQRDLLKNVPKHIQIMGRLGRKAYDDIAGFYMRRDYEEMESNEWWIGDTHTIDIQSKNKDGRLHRLYFSSWLDARSGILVGWHFSKSASSQSTLMALRDAIIRRGYILPKNVYVDNGREFLNHDIGGMGHRARKKANKDEFVPPPVFARMGITMTNALVRNARAKTIERAYRDVKEGISRLFESYTGGNIIEKPERLKSVLKSGDVIRDEDLIQELDALIEYYFNYAPYGGSVTADQGLKKLEVYNKHLKTARKATKDDLELMLMRSSRPQKVGRRGLKLKIGDELFEYFSYELHQMFGKAVYFRYDPNDLSEIRVYDEEDRYLMNVPCADDTVLKYGASKEDIKRGQKLIREIAKKDADVLNAIKSMGWKPARELVLAQAKRNAENPIPPAQAKVLEIQRADEKLSDYAEVLKVVGDHTDAIDLNRMLQNSQKRQGGTEDETDV